MSRQFHKKKWEECVAVVIQQSTCGSAIIIPFSLYQQQYEVQGDLFLNKEMNCKILNLGI